MKKIVFVFFALFLLMFSSCRTLSYTETEVIPSSDAYIGLLCDPNNSVHCFTIESVESYLDTFFSDKKNYPPYIRSRWFVVFRYL